MYVLRSRFWWLMVPLVWVVHLVLHVLGITHTEGPWWYF